MCSPGLVSVYLYSRWIAEGKRRWCKLLDELSHPQYTTMKGQGRKTPVMAASQMVSKLIFKWSRWVDALATGAGRIVDFELSVVASRFSITPVWHHAMPSKAYFRQWPLTVATTVAVKTYEEVATRCSGFCLRCCKSAGKGDLARMCSPANRLELLVEDRWCGLDEELCPCF